LHPAATHLNLERRILIVIGACAGVIWLTGPFGRLMVVFLLLIVTPGYLIERILPGDQRALLLRFALWFGLSLSLIPLGYEWATLVNISLRPAWIGWGLAATTVLATGFAWHDARPTRPSPYPDALEDRFVPALLLLIGIVTIWTRFVQIDGLAAPAWVDSVHHALLVQIAADQGMAPLDLRPALPIEELPYHWGFHVLAATTLRIAGTDVVQTLLWSGQWLNALAAPLAGAFALSLWRRPFAAVGAMLIVGLISFLPAYYVSWGRYTQLSGLLMVPGLVLAWESALRTGAARWWATVAIQLAGLSLVHFRVLIFALALLAALSLVYVMTTPNLDRRSLLRSLLGAGSAALLSLALTAPWMLILVRRIILQAIEQPQFLSAGTGYNRINLPTLWSGHNRILIGLALIAGAWELTRRSRAGLSMILWVGLLFLLANPNLIGYLTFGSGIVVLAFGVINRRIPAVLLALPLLLINPWLVDLPTTWLLNNDSIVISLFLPISAMIAGAAARLLAIIRRTRPQLQTITTGLAVVLILALTGWGAWEMRTIVNQSTVLATAADIEAAAWVRQNTAPDARFLINATVWIDPVHRGTDGGWWLLPLTGRWTSTPPVISTYGPEDAAWAAIDRGRIVAGYQPGAEDRIIELMRQQSIDYIYIGARGGPLQAAALSERPELRVVYERNGVVILALDAQS
jgi:hypothetical protein